MRYYFDRESVPAFADVCKRFSGKALRSPFRSTVPLLSLIGHSSKQWNSVMAGILAPADSPIHLEYRVQSPKRGGNPSQTDALVLAASGVWAVEAKWTEPRYGTVADRLASREEDGSDPYVTLDGWLQRLQPFTEEPLRLEKFGEVIYQMLHRAASACAVAKELGRNPHLVYLHFSPSPLNGSASTRQYVTDLQKLHSLLGKPLGLPFTFIDLPLESNEAFRAIEHLDKSAPASAAVVSAALCAGPLFTFGRPEYIRV